MKIGDTVRSKTDISYHRIRGTKYLTVPAGTVGHVAGKIAQNWRVNFETALITLTPGECAELLEVVEPVDGGALGAMRDLLFAVPVDDLRPAILAAGAHHLMHIQFCGLHAFAEVNAELESACEVLRGLRRVDTVIDCDVTREVNRSISECRDKLLNDATEYPETWNRLDSALTEFAIGRNLRRSHGLPENGCMEVVA